MLPHYRYLSVSRQEEKEEAGCAGTGMVECPSHSPACSHPPGPNHSLIKEREPSSHQQHSASHTHTPVCDFRACFEMLMFGVAEETLRFLSPPHCLFQERQEQRGATRAERRPGTERSPPARWGEAGCVARDRAGICCQVSTRWQVRSRLCEMPGQERQQAGWGMGPAVASLRRGLTDPGG